MGRLWAWWFDWWHVVMLAVMGIICAWAMGYSMREEIARDRMARACVLGGGAAVECEARARVLSGGAP